MTKTWILDVLADLNSFAQSNDLPILAGQLEDATIVAMAEIASKQNAEKTAIGWNDGTPAHQLFREPGQSIGTG